MAICMCGIAIGARFDDRVTGRLDAFSPNSRKVHIDIDRSSINKTVRIDLAIVADAENRNLALPAVESVSERPGQGLVIAAAAPVLLIILRVIQGIAVGGEWAGAALLTASDIVGRVISPSSEEIQVGIITAIIGAPFFIWIVRRQKVREL